MSNDQKASCEAVINRLMDTSNKLGNVESNGIQEEQDDLLDKADGCIQEAIVDYSEATKDAIAYANAEMVKRAKASREYRDTHEDTTVYLD